MVVRRIIELYIRQIRGIMVQQKESTVIDIPCSTATVTTTTTATTTTATTSATTTTTTTKSCKSIPLFVILISIIEITTFVYDYLTTSNSPLGLVPINSLLIYSPSRRQEVWRFLTYMFLHANWFHLGFNVFVQIVVGAPLELVHGSIRIACIYFAGVVAGSLGTSVVDSEVFLVGASGGVYALLAANLADIMINFSTVRFVTIKLLAILLFSSFDFAYAVYSNYYLMEATSSTPTISYIAHLTGALAGLTIGLLVLKNFEEVEVEEKENSNRSMLWWCAFGAYFTFILFTVLFNLLNTMTAQMLEVEGETLIETTFTS